MANKDSHPLAETAQVPRLITLAATVSIIKAAEEKGEEAEEAMSFEIIVLYTFAVIIITLTAQPTWKVGVRGSEFLRQHVFANPGGHPEGAVRSLTRSSLKENVQASYQAEGVPTR